MPHPFVPWRRLGTLMLAALATAHAQTPHVHPGTADAAPKPPAAAAPAQPLRPADPTATWRAANEAVGAFPRGHADIVRWERAHLPPDATGEGASDATAAAPPWTLDDVGRLALRQRPDLLITPGLGRTERLLREQAAAAVIRDAQVAWIEAVAARAVRRLAEEALAAAAAGAELAQRMRQAGNFSAERTLREALVQWDAEARLEQARQAEQLALVRLWQQVGGTDSPQALAHHLPRTLPQHPTPPSADDQPALAAQQRARHPHWHGLQREAEQLRAALSAQDWATLDLQLAQAVARGAPGAARMEPTAPRWPHTWTQALQARQALAQLQRQLDGDLWLALTQAQRAAQRAQRQRAEVLPARRTLEEETALRYNGMLASTWDLLAAARDRSAAHQAAILAERDAWLAWLDLQAVLAGLPYGGRALSPSAVAPDTATKGH